jgi:hypothetical protein
MRLLFLLPAFALAACATADPQDTSEADLAAVRQVTMSGPSLTWAELRVHPALLRRACAVGTLVNADGQTIGYCQGGRQCRTMDWRPIEAGCNRSPEYRAGPVSTPPPATPAATPVTQPGPAIDIARVR